MYITTKQLSEEQNIFTNLTNEEIIVTEKEKPFAVIIDFEKYQRLLNEVENKQIAKKLQLLDSIGNYPLGGKSFKTLKEEQA